VETQTVCKHCKANVSPTDYFCPNCGKKLRDKPQSTGWLRQLVVYAISFLLPPLGLWPAVRYLKQPDQKSKNIGIAAIVITIVSIVLSVYLAVEMLNSINKELNSQLNGYQNMGL
jgi:uncharacterized paraquat-inducible protein A